MSFLEFLNTPFFNVLSVCSGTVLLRYGYYFWKHRNEKSDQDDIMSNGTTAICLYGLGIGTLVCAFSNIWIT